MLRPRFVALVALLVGVLVVAAVAVVWILVPSRTIPLAELRSGTEFSLGGLHFRQTDYSDGYSSDPPIPDAGVTVSFEISFPDGAQEDLAFSFDGYCPAGIVTEEWTEHRGPGAAFRHVCGQDFITVRVV